MRSTNFTTWRRWTLALSLGCVLVGCGRLLPPALPTPNGASLPILTGDNIMKLTVNGSLCSAGSYANKPCVSVTICEPGTSHCRVLNDILLDTGSFGLRVHGSLLAGIPLLPVNAGGKAVAECARFGGGTSDWGPVETADVVLGGEPAVRVPIQVIDAGYPGANQFCKGADDSPARSGFNGILGVGLFRADCGTACAHNAGNQMYFACGGSSCAPTVVSLEQQVQNPVALLPQDGNGVIVELPSIPSGGKASLEGYLVLGVGTRSNNQPRNVNRFSADAESGEFTSSFAGKSYPSFIDSGSNGLFFQPPTQSSVPSCATSSGFATWFCPSNPLTLTAVNSSAGGGAGSGAVPFQIGNATDLLQSGNSVFVELGGGGSSESFDWGLPFYIGRNVYLGFEGAATPIGAGPYWAY